MPKPPMDFEWKAPEQPAADEKVTEQCSRQERIVHEDGAGECTSELERRVQQLLQHYMAHFDQRFDDLLAMSSKQRQFSPYGLSYPSEEPEFHNGGRMSKTRSIASAGSANMVVPSRRTSKEKTRASLTSTAPQPIVDSSIQGEQVMQIASTERNTEKRPNVNIDEQDRLRKLHSQFTLKKITDGKGNRRLLQSPGFEIGVVVAIVVNGLVIGIQTDVVARTGDMEHLVFIITEYFFFVVFFLEFLLRVYWLRSDWVRSGWNVFDAVLLLLQFIEFIFKWVAGGNTVIRGLATSRILRVLRIARIFRLVRLLRFFTQLRVMVKMIWYSLTSLFWLAVLLVVMMYVVSIIFTQGVTDYLAAGSAGLDKVESFEYHFGTLSATAYTLFQVISNGVSWGGVGDLVFEVHFFFGMVFVFFVFFMFFSVLNVVTGVVVDGAIQQGSQERDYLVAVEKKSLEETCSKLIELLVEIDVDGSGTINLEELQQCAGDPKIAHYLTALGIGSQQTEQLFAYLDQDGSGEIDFQEFIEGCVKIRGEAKSIDLHLHMYAMEAKFKHMEELLSATHYEHKKIKSTVAASLQHTAKISEALSGTDEKGTKVNEAHWPPYAGGKYVQAI